MSSFWYRNDTNSMRRNTCPVACNLERSVRETAFFGRGGIITIALGAECPLERADVLRCSGCRQSHSPDALQKLRHNKTTNQAAVKTTAPKYSKRTMPTNALQHTSNGHGA